MSNIPISTPLGIWLGLAALLLCSSCGRTTPTMELVLQEFPDLEAGIYEELRLWKTVLGEPRTVPQLDNGPTFFYWPEHGIAVFTHPLYQGQYRRKGVDDRKVTSVILPLRSSLQPAFLPIAEDVSIHFDRLLQVEASLKAPPTREDEASQGGSHIDLPSSRLSKTLERVHFWDSTLVALEIRDVWWLSHYD